MFSTLREFLPSQNVPFCYKPLSMMQTSVLFSTSNLTNKKKSFYCKPRSIQTFSSNFNKPKSTYSYGPFLVYSNGFLFSKKNLMYGLRPLFSTKPKSSDRGTSLFVRDPQWILATSAKNFPYSRKQFEEAPVLPIKQFSSIRCRSFNSFSKYLERKETLLKKFEGYKLQKQSTKYQIPIRNACKLFILYVCGSFCWLYLITYSNSKKNLSTNQKINFLFQEVVFNNLPLFQKDNLVYTKNLYNKTLQPQNKISLLEDLSNPLSLESSEPLVNLQLSSTIRDLSTQNYIGLKVHTKKDSFLVPSKPLTRAESQDSYKGEKGSIANGLKSFETIKNDAKTIKEVETSNLLKNRFIFFNKKTYLNNLYYYEKNISPFLEEKAKLTFFARKPLFFSSYKDKKIETQQKQTLTQKEQYIYSGTSLILSPELDFFPKKLEHIHKKMSTHSSFSINFLPKLGQKEKLKWCNDLNPIGKNSFLYTDRNYNYTFNLSLGSLSNGFQNGEKALYLTYKNPKIATSLYSGLRKKDLQLIKTFSSLNREGFILKKLEFGSEAFSLETPLILNHIFKLLRTTTKNKNYVVSETKENVRNTNQTEKTEVLSLDRNALKETKNPEGLDPKLLPLELNLNKQVFKKKQSKEETSESVVPVRKEFQALSEDTQKLWFSRKDCQNNTIWSKAGSPNHVKFIPENNEGLLQKEKSRYTDVDLLGFNIEGQTKLKQESSRTGPLKATLVTPQKSKSEKSNLRRFFFDKKKVIHKMHLKDFFMNSRLHSGFNFPNTSIIKNNQNDWKKSITLRIKNEDFYNNKKCVIPKPALTSLLTSNTLKDRQKQKNKKLGKGVVYTTDSFFNQKRSVQRDPINPEPRNLPQTSFLSVLYELKPLQEYITYKQSNKSKNVSNIAKGQIKDQGFIQFQKKNKKITEFLNQLKTTRFKELWNFTSDTSLQTIKTSISDQNIKRFEKNAKKSNFGVTIDSKGVCRRDLRSGPLTQFWKNQSLTSFIILDQNSDIQIKEKFKTSCIPKTPKTDFNFRPYSTRLLQNDYPYESFTQNAPESFFGVPYLQLGERFTIEKLKSKGQIGTFYSVHSQNNLNNLLKPTFPFASMGTSLKTIFGKKFLKQTSKTKTQNLVTDARLVKNWSVVHFPENKLNQNVFENDLFSTFTKDLFFESELLDLSKQTNKQNNDNFLQKNLLYFKRISGKANGYIINPFQYYNPGTKRERNIEDTMLTLEGYRKSRLFPKVKVSFQGISAVTLPINEKLKTCNANKNIDLQSILGGMRQRTEIERKAENFIQARAFNNSFGQGLDTPVYEGLRDEGNTLYNSLNETQKPQKEEFSNPETSEKEKGLEKQSLLQENNSLSQENSVLPFSAHDQKKRHNQRSKPLKKLRFTNCYPLQTLLSASSQKTIIQPLKHQYVNREADFSEYYVPPLNFASYLSTNAEPSFIQNSSQTKGFYFEKLANKNTFGILNRKFWNRAFDSSSFLKKKEEQKDNLLTLNESNQKPRTKNSFKTSLLQLGTGIPTWTSPSYDKVAGKLSKIIFFGSIWFSYKILASKLTHSTQFLPAVFTEAVGLQSFQKKYRIIKPQKTKESFKNLAGAEKTLAELRDLIWTFGLVGTSGPRGEHSYLSSFSYFGSWAGQRRNSIFSKDRNRFLLVGPPGTGKTLLVKALAKEANVPIIVQPVSQLRMITGVENPISALFHVARQIKPCIIFLDELDTLGTDFHVPNTTKTGEQKGSNAQWASLARKFTYTLLLELDGLTSSTQDLLIIGATNRPETLNPALTRAGRFETIINCSLPSQKQRFSVLSLYLSLLRKKDFNKRKIGSTLGSAKGQSLALKPWSVGSPFPLSTEQLSGNSPLSNMKGTKELTPFAFLEQEPESEQNLGTSFGQQNKMKFDGFAFFGKSFTLSQWSTNVFNLNNVKHVGSTKSGSSFKNIPKDKINILKNNQKFYVNYLAKKSLGLSQASIGTAVNESAMDAILNHSSSFHTLKSLEQAIESVKTLTTQPTNFSNFVNPFVPVTNFNTLWKDFDYKKGQKKMKNNSKWFVGQNNTLPWSKNNMNDRFNSQSGNSFALSKFNLNVKIWPFLVYMSYQTTGSLVIFYKKNSFRKQKKQVLKKITPIIKSKVSRNTLLARRAQIRQDILTQRFSIKNKKILCYVKNKPTSSTFQQTQIKQINQNFNDEKDINGTLNNKMNFEISLYRHYGQLASTNLYSSIRPQNLKLSNKFGLYKNPIAVSANLLILKYLTTKFHSLSNLSSSFGHGWSENIQGAEINSSLYNSGKIQSPIGQTRTQNNTNSFSSKISPKFISQNDFLKVLEESSSFDNSAKLGFTGFSPISSGKGSGHVQRAAKGIVVRSTISSLFQKNRENKNSFRFKEELSRQIQLSRPLTTSWFRIYLSRPIFRYEVGEYIENREYYPQNNYNLICQSLHIANLSVLAHRLYTTQPLTSKQTAFVLNSSQTKQKTIKGETFVGQRSKEFKEIPLDLTIYLAIVASIFHKTSVFIGKNRELLDYCVYNNLRYGTLYDFSINQICKKF